MKDKTEGKQKHKPSKDENGLYITSPVWKLIENFIAKFFWIGFLLIRFVISLCWNVLKLAWAERKVKPAEQSQSPQQQASQAIAEQVIATVVDVDKRFVPAQALRNVHDDDWSLYLRLFPDRIERTLKTERERPPWMRATCAFKRTVLQPMTRQLAEAAGVDFSFDGAVVMTKKEFAGQTFFKPSQLSIEDAKPTISITQPKFEEKPEEEKTSHGVEYVGVVASAGVVEIRPESGRNYNTFLVTIVSSNGEKHDLQGVDLHEKFQRREFSVNDTIRVLKKTESYKKGNEKRKKNSFQITVIKHAAY